MEPSSSSPADPVRLPRGRRYTVRALLVAGTVLAVLSIFAVFANRQVLNADNWSDTSSALLENSAIRAQVSVFLVDQVYSNVDVQKQVADALPKRLTPLAGPAANGLRELAEKRANRFLERPRVQEGWKAANRITAQQFINIAEGNSAAITAQGNAVVLDLRVVMQNLIERLGLPRSLADKIPPNAGRINIMTSSQISTMQDVTNLLKSLALVLPILAFGCLGLAVFLAHGRRRQTLFSAGVDLIVAGAIVLVARNLLGDHVVGVLATTDAVKPAAEAAWSIGTHMLRDVAQAVIITGIPLVIAAWLAGERRPAIALRRSMAPWLRERPGVTYGVAGALALLVVAWGPIPATRMVVPVLIMVALLALGVEALRRQTALEFPDATFDSTRESFTGGLQRARQAVFGPHGPATANGHQVTNGAPGHVEELERLSALHDHGALSDAEFAAEKAALVN